MENRFSDPEVHELKINNATIFNILYNSKYNLFQKEINQSVPKNLTGVYLLCNLFGSVVYVGQSKNLKSRIIQSIIDKNAFYYLYYIPENPENVELLENCLISYHRPIHNKKYIYIEKIKSNKLLTSINIVSESSLYKTFDFDYKLLGGI